MQTAMTAAPLSSKACISRSLIKGRPSRAVPVCRFSKGPVPFKEDNPLEVRRWRLARLAGKRSGSFSHAYLLSCKAFLVPQLRTY